MQLSQTIYQTLADLVDSRVYPLVVPETIINKPPYIVYQFVNGEPTNTLDGYTGNSRVLVQIDVYHSNYDDCLTLAKQVIWQIDTNIKNAVFDSSQSLFENLDSTAILYRQCLEFFMWQSDC